MTFAATYLWEQCWEISEQGALEANLHAEKVTCEWFSASSQADVVLDHSVIGFLRKIRNKAVLILLLLIKTASYRHARDPLDRMFMTN